MARSHSTGTKAILAVAGLVFTATFVGALAGAESASGAEAYGESVAKGVDHAKPGTRAEGGDPVTREIATRYLRVFNDTDPKKVDPTCTPETLISWPGGHQELVKLQQTSSMSKSGEGANSLGSTYDQATQEKSVVIAQDFRSKRPAYPVGVAATGVRASDGAFVLRVKNFSAAPTDFVDILPGETKTLTLGSPDDPELTWTVTHTATKYLPAPRSSAFDALTDIRIAVYEAPDRS